MFFMHIRGDNNDLKAERLYYKYRKLMYKEAYALLQDHMLAEDVINESFVRIIDKLHKIDETDCPKTRNFLVIVCRNVARDFYRRKHLSAAESQIAEEAAGGNTAAYTNPEDIVISKENIMRVADIIQELDPIYKDTFLLRRVYGFSRAEIAGMLGASEEAVKKRLVRVKRKIIEKMGGENDYE